jgi:hypothetical protein
LDDGHDLRVWRGSALGIKLQGKKGKRDEWRSLTKMNTRREKRRGTI